LYNFLEEMKVHLEEEEGRVKCQVNDVINAVCLEKQSNPRPSAAVAVSVTERAQHGFFSISPKQNFP
jgi:hypothetical protein